VEHGASRMACDEHRNGKHSLYLFGAMGKNPQDTMEGIGGEGPARRIVPLAGVQQAQGRDGERLVRSGAGPEAGVAAQGIVEQPCVLLKEAVRLSARSATDNLSTDDGRGHRDSSRPGQTIHRSGQTCSHRYYSQKREVSEEESEEELEGADSLRGIEQDKKGIECLGRKDLTSRSIYSIM
jgi:hypothetical protein